MLFSYNMCKCKGSTNKSILKSSAAKEETETVHQWLRRHLPALGPRSGCRLGCSHLPLRTPRTRGLGHQAQQQGKPHGYCLNPQLEKLLGALPATPVHCYAGRI